MASTLWTGNAQAVAQVNTITPSTPAVGNTFTVTINGKAITYTAAATTVADVTAGLVALLSASTIPEFAEITWTDSTTLVTATAKTAGVPFTQTSSAAAGTGGGSPTCSTSTTTSASGPNFWSTAANWSGGSVPVSTNDVYIENSAVSILYGLAQSAVTLNSLNIAKSFTGTIGLPITNANGYPEYRATYLAISSTTTNIGKGENGSGSGRIKIDFGSTATTLNVFDTGTPAENTTKSLIVKGSGSNIININKGSVAIAPVSNETATVSTLTTGSLTSGTLDVAVGPGVTLTTATIAGGTVTMDCNCPTITMSGGTLKKLSGTISTSITIDGGTAYLKGSGTIAQLNVGNGGVADFSTDATSRTVSGINLYSGGKLLDPGKTLGNVTVAIVGCSWSDVKWDMGEERTVALS